VSLRIRFRGLALLLWACFQMAHAESDSRLTHLGILVPPVPSVFEAPLIDSLRKLGYVDGSTVTLTVRRSSGAPQDWRPLADELVRANVDLILAVGTPAAQAAMEATQTIPIVFGVGDPVSTGLAGTLARPGRNGTGVSAMSTELAAKRLELLRQLVPAARRVVYLYNPITPLGPRMRDEVQRAAAALQVKVDLFEARDARQIETAMEQIVKSRTDGLLVSSELLFLVNRDRIVEVTNAARLPAVFPWKAFTSSGGIASYGPHNEEGMRRMAMYADRVLKGTKPSDLPIEQLSAFHLVLNLGAAKAQGIAIPETFRAMADEVIR
jgi:putative ABC transport system substrate-binding protein